MEPFLKRYLINHVSTVKSEPIRFPKSHFHSNYLFSLLISKREYEHRRIIENYDHSFTDSLEIMLPWNRSIDIRYKHYLSPKDEQIFRASLNDHFYYEMHRYYLKRFWMSGKSVNAIFDEMAELFDFSHELDYEKIKQRFYRQMSKTYRS
jgi:hypothetical protein